MFTNHSSCKNCQEHTYTYLEEKVRQFCNLFFLSYGSSWYKKETQYILLSLFINVCMNRNAKWRRGDMNRFQNNFQILYAFNQTIL